MKTDWFSGPGFPVWALALVMLTANGFAAANNVEQSLAAVLRERVSGARPAAALPVQGGPIRTLATLTKVYDERGYAPLWIDAGGLTGAARELIDVLATTEEHGIAPARYRLTLIRALANAAEVGATETRVDLELLLTDAFLMHAADLVSGRVDPASLDPLWAAQQRARDLPRIIEQAALGRPGEILADLAPPHPQYAALREALRRLHAEHDPAAGWPSVPGGPVLEFGNTGERVARLNRSLAGLGYLAPDQSGDNYSETTRDAVRQFQRDNGLEPDGMAGPKTLAQLNESSPSAQARRIALNLERWRWLPDDLGTRNLQVNVAAYDLRLQDDGNTELAMKVIVGREARR
ncbi:MAG: peptidoglycan-binding protein, partial [Pseudomonadota bacterium]|nr:peptidoglycan-binding protein [Pseudomonadota bacterium]